MSLQAFDTCLDLLPFIMYHIPFPLSQHLPRSAASLLAFQDVEVNSLVAKGVWHGSWGWEVSINHNNVSPTSDMAPTLCKSSEE